MQHVGAENFAMGRCQLQREKDEIVISCERLKLLVIRALPAAV